MAKILIIDDEKAIRQALKEILLYEKYQTDEAKDGEEAYEKLTQSEFDVALCDIKMPRLDGMELLQKITSEGIQTKFIMISAHGSIETAVEATKIGAFDFIQKPPDLNKLLVIIRNALENKSLQRETTVLKQKIARNYEIIGESEVIKELKIIISKVAPTDAKVLIEGPNGSGKELVARQLYANSKRANMPFIEVNCAAIPSELIESELFGHEKGSFTSAIKHRTGKFEQADGGTLFLDEIGDMSLAAQAKVLRALQEKKISKVGGDKDITVDVRILAATNKNLTKEIELGNFREDLYHRIAVVKIIVPSLDDRIEDLPLLINKFLIEIANEYGTKTKTIDTNAIDYLQQLKWKGNVRELRNVAERLHIMSNTSITLADAQKYASK
ncbi:MAG: sigma-54 dependent transcriptional regulator [Bacteroidota bacterium]|nr:sigma-54 dependent transcriptional regulator [Bacteroidota bacterium]